MYLATEDKNLRINFSNMTAVDIDTQLTMQLRRCLM